MRDRDATSAEPLEDEGTNYAKSPWEIVDKHFFHRGLRVPVGIALAISIVSWIVLVAWLLIQDNSQGRLDTTEGWNHFFSKAMVATGLVLLGGIALVLLGRAAAFGRWVEKKLGFGT